MNAQNPKPEIGAGFFSLGFPSGLSLDSTELIEVRVEDWFSSFILVSGFGFRVSDFGFFRIHLERLKSPPNDPMTCTSGFCQAGKCFAA